MSKKIYFFLLLFFFSCTTSFNFYEKVGFSKLSDDSKITSNLPKGTLIKVTNLNKKIDIITKTQDQTKSLGSRVIALPEKLYEKLKLDRNFPLIRIQSIRENKTFVAKKVKTFDSEKKVKNKVKLEEIKVLDLNNTLKENKKIYLNFGPFYFKSYADGLYKVIDINLKNKKILFKNYNQKNYIISIGPLKNLQEYDEMYFNLGKIGLIGFNIDIQ